MLLFDFYGKVIKEFELETKLMVEDNGRPTQLNISWEIWT